MTVRKIKTENATIEILGVTLLTEEEAQTLLTPEEKLNKNIWWLKTPGNKKSSVKVVEYGKISEKYTYETYVCVYPALNIDISDTEFNVGDIFILGDKEFKILTPTLAWMYRDNIGCCCFKKEFLTADANVYENSDVKKKIEKWFENTTNDIKKKEENYDA